MLQLGEQILSIGAGTLPITIFCGEGAGEFEGKE